MSLANDADGPNAEEALHAVLSTRLRSVRAEHSAKIGRNAAAAVAAILEEYAGPTAGSPVPPPAILTNLLGCIAEHPTL